VKAVAPVAMACAACCAIPLLAVTGIAVAPVGVAVAAAGAAASAFRKRRRRSAAGRQGPFVSGDETRTIR